MKKDFLTKPEDIILMPWYRRLLLPWVLLSLLACIYFFYFTFLEYSNYKKEVYKNKLRLEEVNTKIQKYWDNLLENLDFLSTKASELEIEIDTDIINSFKKSPPYPKAELILAAKTLTILEVKNAFSISTIEHLKCLTDKNDPCEYYKKQKEKIKGLLGIALFGLLIESITDNDNDISLTASFINFLLNSQKNYLDSLINTTIRDIVNDPTNPKELMKLSNNRKISNFPFLLDLILIATAHAQNNDVKKNSGLEIQFRWFIYAALGIAWFLCIFKILFSKNNHNIDVAIDLLKTLTGFFIGVGTTMST